MRQIVHTQRCVLMAFVLTADLCVSVTSLCAQTDTKSSPMPAEQVSVDVESPADLNSRQQAISSRYQRFEKLLLQLADYLRQTDPERADLLIRAFGRSREDRIPEQMERIAGLLQDEDFNDALERQDDIVKRMREVLGLLQSEDRRSELEAEQEYIKRVLKDVRKLIGQQKVASANTIRASDLQRAADGQEKVTDQTDQLIKDIKAADKERQPGSESSESDARDPADSTPDGKSPKNKAGDKERDKPHAKTKDGDSDDKDAESEKDPNNDDKAESEESSQNGKSSDSPDSDAKNGDSKESSSESPESKSSDQPPSESQGQQSPSGQPSPSQQEQQPSDKTPGREQIEQARDQMQQAIEQLREQNRDDASKHQQEAIAELLKAREELEEMLRQLREEERELMLAALESRFQKMRMLQLQVNTDTTSLSRVPEANWQTRHTGRSRELSQIENDIALEADKALDILKQEGSSVAFPIAIEHLREDMLTVAERLGRSKVDEFTQAVERDILEALDEMVLSLQKEMEKGDSGQQPGQQGNQQQEQALVDAIAELKMLRTLQRRIYRRTKEIGRLFRGNQAEDPEVVTQLQELARRHQARVQDTAEGIVRALEQ